MNGATLTGASHAGAQGSREHMREGVRHASQVDAMLRSAMPHMTPSDGSRSVNGGRGVTTLLCASGRGGSGTTLVSALTAMAAAAAGYRVLLVDADEMVGPLSMLLGARASASWTDLRGGRIDPRVALTPVSETLTLVAGGAPRIAQVDAKGHPIASGDITTMNSAERRACMRRVSALADGMDLVIVDCGARLESVLAAATPHTGEHLLAITAGRDPIALAATYALCKATHARLPGMSLDVLVNRIDGADAAQCFEAIHAGARQFIPNCVLRFAGAIPLDSTLDAAMRAGMPFPDAAAGSPAALAAQDLALRAVSAASTT